MNRPPLPHPARRRWLRRLLLLLAPPLLLGTGAAAGALAGAAAAGPDPAPGTVLLVEGDAANGFGILRYDGSWEFPPTRSETRAECDEYDRHVDRVRCRVEARTWFRDLGELQRSIDYYRAELRDRGR